MRWDIESVTTVRERVLTPPGRAALEAWYPLFDIFPPHHIEWNRVGLPLRRLDPRLNGLRILHVSDLHLRREWPAALDPLLDRIEANPPDILFFTGDFVDNKLNHRPSLPVLRRLVDRFLTRFGSFAIHGNHDNYGIGKDLAGPNLTFVDGRQHLINMSGGRIEVIGLPGKHRKDLHQSFVDSVPPPMPGVPRIVLSHFPDHLKRTTALDADLFLAGHTHGGQICLPGSRALLSHDSLSRRLASGAHRIGKTWLIVSRGIGYTGIPLRLFCPPEVTEIVVRAES